MELLHISTSTHHGKADEEGNGELTKNGNAQDAHSHQNQQEVCDQLSVDDQELQAVQTVQRHPHSESR